jgi:hypothetical protein
VRLLRLGFGVDEADAARAALHATLTRTNLSVEAAYLRDRPSFERTYGWAWLLRLGDELDALGDPDARAWRAALAPVVGVVRDHWLEFLPRAGYPIRAGTHANTAFGLAFALDHARATGDDELTAAIEAVADGWFADDAAYPAHLEPAGDDFLSGALTEAAFMTRLRDPPTFGRWLSAFLPGMADRRPAVIFAPAHVADRTDPKTVHLDGLNLSRAWCWARLATALADDELAAMCREAASAHLEAGLPRLFSGEYAADHWLTSFALLALTV